jgi:uncharacterized protein YneF (UPF0154 family)
MDFLVGLLLVAAGLVCGYFIGIFRAIAALKSINQQLVESLVKQPKESKPKLRMFKIDHNNGVMYLYDMVTDSFVCQGSSLVELAGIVSTTHSVRLAGVVNGEDKLWFINGKVYDDSDPAIDFSAAK